MELINRERLIETICGTVSEVAMTAPYDATWFTRMARRQFEIIEITEIIKNMPAIQTQLEYEGKVLVRCFECKYGDMCSIRDAMAVSDRNAFCYRGERKYND